MKATVLYRALATTTLCIGVATLCGWLLHPTLLTRVSALVTPMPIHTALGFVVLSTGVLAMSFGGRLRAVAIGAGLLSALWGTACMTQHLLQTDLGLSAFAEDTSVSAFAAPSAATSLVLCGFSLAGSAYRSSWRRPASLLSAATIGVAFASLLSYLGEDRAAFGWGSGTRMAIHAASGFLLLGFVLTAIAWESVSNERAISPTALEDALPLQLVLVIGAATLSLAYAAYFRDQHLRIATPEAAALIGRSSLPAAILVSGCVFAGVTGYAIAVAARARNGANAMRIIVDQQQRTDEELLENQRLLALQKYALDEHSIVAITNPKGVITYVNDKFCDISGYEPEELIGQTHQVVNSGHHPKSFFVDMWGKIARGETWSGEICNRAKDGHCYWVATTIVPFKNRTGRIVEYVAIRTDVTARRSTETKLQQAYSDLRQFAYVASHDLQEPLRAVASHLDILASECGGILTEDANQSLHFALDGAKRMRSLLEDLLSFSRIERDAQPRQAVPLDEPLQDAMYSLEVAINESGAVITSDPLPTVSIYPGQITQLLQNLIANAIKFRGTEVPRVHVSGSVQSGSLVLSVKDNGIGIDPKYADRIFEVFQRLHARDQYPGTGMGLAICKRIVERHDGNIRVRSTPGDGAEFIVTLPATSEEVRNARYRNAG